MTPRKPQCEVFWALLSSSEHSGVPEDSKSPTFQVLGFTPTLGQSGVATAHVEGWFMGVNMSSPTRLIRGHLGFFKSKKLDSFNATTLI
jgi:hypothetical protein